MVATSCQGKQVRVSLGRWPLISIEEARARAMEILRLCRAGEMPVKRSSAPTPTLREALPAYAAARRIKPSSLMRYESVLRTHFQEWLDRSVATLGQGAFNEHCHRFAQANGPAVVELARGLIGSLFKYINAIHSLDLKSPFVQLSHAGLMPAPSKPRARKLQEHDLATWRRAVEALPDSQRDYLLLVALTGLRRNECSEIRVQDVDLAKGVLSIPETKNGKVHTLPITEPMRKILARRCSDLPSEGGIFTGISANHVPRMAGRFGAPDFMLHDLRKMVATMGEKLGVPAASIRRILNHSPNRSDVLYRHYVSLGPSDIRAPLEEIQSALAALMKAV